MSGSEIPEEWLRPIEHIAIALKDAKQRTIGLSSVGEGAGVSMTAAALATAYARSGVSTLLLDATQPLSGSAPVWLPGKDSVDWFVTSGGPDRYDRIALQLTPNDRFLFNNKDVVQQLLTSQLSRYDFIVVDLPALLVGSAQRINPLALASACDSVILLCKTGRDDRTSVETAMQLLGMAGCNFAGAIMNDGAP